MDTEAESPYGGNGSPTLLARTAALSRSAGGECAMRRSAAPIADAGEVGAMVRSQGSAAAPSAGVPPLALRLLGPFEARVHGAPLSGLYSRKGQWLLALLVLRHGRDVERRWLAGTFWPEAPEEQGLYYLRRELTHLRRALGPEASRLR